MTSRDMNVQIEDVSSIVERFHRSVKGRFEHVAIGSSRFNTEGSEEIQCKRARKYRLAALQFKALAKYGDRMAKTQKKQPLRRIGSDFSMSNRG
mmetsp:Transcript_81907/g.219957  ORF Transcript_81907/g.219957 Transcript_81907/m.219957 type:complete len:94 (-) Transcript_81907:76-357(-)